MKVDRSPEATMRRVKWYLLVGATFLALMLTQMVQAADATLGIAMPARDVENNVIPTTGPSSIAGGTMQYGSCTTATPPAFGTSAGQVTFTGPVTQVVVPGLAVGQTYCFRANVRNAANETSGWSNVVSRTIPTPAPGAPVLSSTITIAFGEYEDWKGKKILMATGEIDIGTACNPKVAMKYKGTVLHEIDAKHVRTTAPSARWWAVCA